METANYLQNFFDTVTWYGTPFVKNFLTNHKKALSTQCHKDIWAQKGVGFKKEAHLFILQNDYQYLLAYITYRFADPGAYEFVISLYKSSIAEIPEAIALLKIWELTEVKHRSCFTNWGVSCGILSDNAKSELRNIYYSAPHNSTSGIVAKCLLHESYINEQRILGRSSDEAAKDLGYSDATEFTLMLNGMTTPMSTASMEADSLSPCHKDIVNDVTRAWNELDEQFIVKHLSADFRYDSQWVFDYMLCNDYIEYIRKKFQSIKAGNTSIKATTVEDKEIGGWMTKIVQSNGQNENVCYYRIKVKSGKIVKGDLCMF